jgi:aspartyl-tRNA(Asn)/glutamyl-tRNA(Gln) amidotransferase subunit A
VTGLKPTYGRVSRYGLIAYGSSLDVVGAFGRSAADVALVFTQMAGYDARDATTLNLPVPEISLDGRESLKGLRVGVPEEYFIAGIQPEVETAVRQAVGVLESLGAEARPVSLSHTRYALPVYYLIAPAEASANLARFDGVRYGPRVDGGSMWETYRQTRGEGFGPEVKRRIMIGTYALSAGYYDAYYLKAQKVRALIARDFAAAFREVDAIVAPVSPFPAFKLGEKIDDPLEMYLSDIYTITGSLAGLPCMSVPCGKTAAGLPVGMQILTKHFDEAGMLRLADAFERAGGVEA